MIFKRFLVWAAMLCACGAGAQTSMFTYQGRLASGGSVVTGLYDLRFALYDGSTNLIAGPVTNAPVGVTNGLFVTTLDFGAVAFNGNTRSLAIAVRPYGNTNAYNALAPNQVINSTPYAIQALVASNAIVLTEPLAATNISGVIPVGNLSSNVALLNSNETFTGSVTAGNFYGGGAGLTGIPASSLTGTLPDTTLSANVPLFSKADNFSNSVTAVQFNGSGYGLTNVPGAFFWLTVNGTTAQASSNLGFIVTNNVAPVTITLPSNPSAGDTFRVAGVGEGGWILAQNPGQYILAANLVGPGGLTWSPSGSGTQPWSSVASSADGTKLVATVGGIGKTGYIYTSANSGVTWTATATAYGAQNWSSVASSADGTKLVATVGTASGVTGLFYVSANSGSSWTQVSPTEQWIGCASSADGSHLIVVAYNGFIGESANAGATWSYASEGATFTGAASSEDGTKLAVCGISTGGYIYTSTNAGSTWTQQAGSYGHNWTAIASSSDGTHLVAAATGTGGGIFVSANAGVTWVEQNQNTVNWTAVASSADGSKLAAVYNGGTVTSPGYVYGSVDSGLTWAQRLGATNAPWISIASSADGSKLAAAAYNGYIYTSGQDISTTGTNGYLFGAYQSALELQYVGNGVFLPLSHEGTIRAY